MHISEGVLSPPVLAAGWAVAAGGLAVGLRKTPAEELPKTALVSGVLFLISLVHVPLGPSSIHLTLLGMAGLLLGWSVVPALFTALLLQALLLQFGGILSLGVNTAVMGAAALTAYGVFQALPRRFYLLSAFAAGFIAVIAGAALVTAALFFSNGNLALTAALIFAANVPLAAVEGIVSVFMIAFVKDHVPRSRKQERS
ncbi:MAG: cobalt transporter CbiM [Spirochaetaceae bacterium]|jgi:cobalt/nickel transport system permease protein|nr:cobalt transporter CbiM [Spirochaetaceae bacterium]